MKSRRRAGRSASGDARSRHCGGVRIAIVTESFLPHMNGVTGSVLHVSECLRRSGHELLVIAPSAARGQGGADAAVAHRVPSVALPAYPAVRVSAPHSASLVRRLRRFDPDVVHLASPFVLGWQGLVAADELALPSVAVYQTDVVAYTRHYRMPQATALAERHVARLHRRATLTLAPSHAARAQLERLGVDRLSLWGRGVDGRLFHPARRDDSWRADVLSSLPAGGTDPEVVVGYVGRLAPEKQVEDLVALRGIPGVRLVIVGDGPSRTALEQQLPEALFLGHLSGPALARAVAGFDVFVHPGASETFGQTIQEAMAAGVPVVAVGQGGPLDLVRSSIDGWLYRPGDLSDLRARVTDLAGDSAKRRAFGAAAHEVTQGRTWEALTGDLLGHYERARRLRRIDDARLASAAPRPELPVPTSPGRPAWRRYVALGDSITEGLCDTSRVPAGTYRGWADRLAHLLAHSSDGGEFRYANLAVRSRRVQDLLTEQLPAAVRMRPDLVSVLIGANDLVGRRVDIAALAAAVGGAVESLRASGADVLLVTPFLPRRRPAMLFARRFALFNAELRRIARRTGAMLLDLDCHPEIGGTQLWSADKVHLRAAGHRLLAYRAADALGVPDAGALSGLDEAFHAEDEPPVEGTWLRRDALPWIWRRLRGRTAGDGISAKHDDYVVIPGPGSRDRARQD